MHDERTANLLGATSLAVRDLLVGDARQRAGLSESSAAAVIVLSTAPDLSVTELGRRIGLTQSAAARMVDSLETSDLARRRPGRGKEVAVRLTADGRGTARTLLAARGAGLAEVLEDLDASERDTLATLLGKLLTRLYARTGDAHVLCRLCDRGSCTTGAVCPIGEADRTRAGA